MTRPCAICADPDDHHGAAHSDATGDGMGRYGPRLPGGGFPGRMPTGAIVCGGKPTDSDAAKIRAFADALAQHAGKPLPERGRAVQQAMDEQP